VRVAEGTDILKAIWGLTNPIMCILQVVGLKNGQIIWKMMRLESTLF